MLKKIVSLVVGAALVLATLGVAAASVSTESVYNADGAIDVTTTVTGTSANEVYTYLAYKLNTSASVDALTKDEVVYVDEQTVVENENIVFTYTTVAGNNDAVVLVGGAGSTEGVPAQNTISAADPAVYRNYTVAVNDGAAAEKTVEITDLDSNAWIDITADVANAVITSVTVNGTALNTYFATNTGIKVPLSAIAENAAVVITTEAGAEASAVYALNGAYIAVDTEDENNYASVIAVAKVEGIAGEYGIEFSASKDDFTNAIKAKALGKGTNGLYAIKLYGYDQNDSSLAGADVVYARAYADNLVSEDIQEIVINVVAD